MTPIGLKEERRGEVTVVRLQGRLDGTNCQTVESFILARVDAGARRLVLDLAGLTYISSAGLWVVLTIRKRIAALGGVLALSGPKPVVHEVFKLSGFLPFLTIAPDLDAALAAVSR